MADDRALDTAISLAASINGSDFSPGGNEVSVLAVISGGGSPVGSLALEFSINGTNFVDIEGTTLAVAADGNFGWTLESISYPRVRIAYTRTSGSGSLTSRYSWRK